MHASKTGASRAAVTCAALGGLGGAYGGSLIGQGQGLLASTAAGALLGAGVGGYLGSFFDQVNHNSSSIQGLSERPAANPATVYPAPAIYSVPPQTGYPQSYQQIFPIDCTRPHPIPSLAWGERDDTSGGSAVDIALWVLGIWFALSALASPMIGLLGRANETPRR